MGWTWNQWLSANERCVRERQRDKWNRIRRRKWWWWRRRRSKNDDVITITIGKRLTKENLTTGSYSLSLWVQREEEEESYTHSCSEIEVEVLASLYILIFYPRPNRLLLLKHTFFFAFKTTITKTVLPFFDFLCCLLSSTAWQWRWWKRYTCHIASDH